MPTRTFTHDQLDDSRRWVSVHQLVFRAPDDGRAYRVTYQLGLTEHQECDLWRADEIKAVEVEPRQVTVTHWVPVAGESA